MPDITFEENEANMKEAQEILDTRLQKSIPNSKVLELKTIEAFVNGKYSPQCTVSTSVETEYVTITFQDRSTTQVMLTKKSFEEFLNKLELFRDMSAPKSGTYTRQLLLDGR